MRAKIIRAIGLAWLSLAGLAITAHAAMILHRRGFAELTETFSPFNVRHFLAIAALLSPGIALIAWADHLKKPKP